MHDTALDFVTRALTAEDVKGLRVLEVGSYDVNGSVRPHVESLSPAEYLGVDQSAGPRVDRVMDCLDLVETLGAGTYDVVISTEMMEHVRDWKGSMRALIDMVRPGGLLVVTTRSPGFPYHAYPEDHWRYTVEQMRQIIAEAGLDRLMLEPDPDPGVFVKARKPDDWTGFDVAAWLAIEPTAPV